MAATASKRDPWAELEDSMKAAPPKGAKSLSEIAALLGISSTNTLKKVDSKKFETGIFLNPSSRRRERYYWPKESQ